MQAKNPHLCNSNLVKMKKLVFGFIISFLITNIALAQPRQLMLKKGDKGFYIDHSVAAHEGLFAIGRVYNAHPKAIAAYNNLDMNKGLSIGQVIHIPLTDTNFTQQDNKGIPVYYKTGEAQSLSNLSVANNKVSMQNLRDWNKLSNDNVPAGAKLIVGFLISNGNPVAAVPKIAKEESPKLKEEKDIKTDPAEQKQIAKTDAVTERPKEEIKKEEPKKEEPKKEEIIVTKPQVIANMSGQGYFKSSFDQQVKTNPVSKTETVTAGIFKTSSGLQDAKFYLLIDGVQSGTIIRVINPENNKAVYAKVLGEMNGIRQNQGLNIRLSNAAASTLGITDTDKFIVKLNY
jgi:hypothetical protein